MPSPVPPPRRRLLPGRGRGRPAIAVATLLVALTLSVDAAMTEFQTLAERVLRQPDAAFATLDTARAGALAATLSQAAEGDPLALPPDAEAPPRDGLALVAPALVRPKPEQPLTVLVALRQSGLRGWQVDEAQNLTVVATDLDSGALRQWQPLHGDKRMQRPPPSASGEPPDAHNAAARSTAVYLRDLRAMLPADGRSTRLAVVALNHDWVSNVAPIEISAGPPVPPAPASPSAGIIPADPSCPPADDGVLLAAAGADAFRIALRLPLNRLPVAQDEDQPGRSVAHVNLLLGRLDALAHDVVALTVPVTIDASQPRQLRAVADLRLPATVLPAALRAQSTQLWLLAGDRVAGPLPLR